MRMKANASRIPEQPYTDYAVLQRHVKGEDVIFVIPDLSALAPRTGLAKWAVYAVCDGHGGTSAARFVRKHLGKALINALPHGQPPPPSTYGPATHPDDLSFIEDFLENQQFCWSVRRALVTVFISLQDAFRSEGYQTSGPVQQHMGCGNGV